MDFSWDRNRKADPSATLKNFVYMSSFYSYAALAVCFFSLMLMITIAFNDLLYNGFTL